MWISPERRIIRFGRKTPAWPSTDEITVCHRHGLAIEDGYEHARFTQDGYNILEYAWRIAPAPSPAPVAQPPLALEIAPIHHVKAPKEASIEDRFVAFHQANPQVYTALRHMALDLKRAGARRIGVKMLWEKLRYEYAIQTQGDDFGMNNIYPSRFARMLAADPELTGLFELRELRA